MKKKRSDKARLVQPTAAVLRGIANDAPAKLKIFGFHCASQLYPCTETHNNSEVANSDYDESTRACY